MTVSIIIDQKSVEEPVLDDAGEPTGEMAEVFKDYSDEQKKEFQQAVRFDYFSAARGAQLKEDPNGYVDDRFSVSMTSVEPIPTVDPLRYKVPALWARA